MAGDDRRFRPVHRLGRATGFGGVFAGRRVLRGSMFDLHYAINAAGTARFGVVIPKRCVRHAVLRNRCKRVARELFRQRRAGLPAYDLVLRMARLPGAASTDMNLDNSALREDIIRLLARLPALPPP